MGILADWQTTGSQAVRQDGQSAMVWWIIESRES